MTDINKLIEDTERLLAARTPGEWDVHGGHGGDVWIGITDGPTRDATQIDLDLMNYAPTALRALVDEVKRLQGVYQLACAAIDESTICPDCNSRESESVCTKCEHHWGD